MSREQEQFDHFTQAERIRSNPPQLILVFDNWRGSKNRTPHTKALEDLTMDTRAAVTARFFHSDLYPDSDFHPIICCFAGKHTPHGIAGSTRVAAILIETFDIPVQKIYLKENTITTTTDLIQLHATLMANSISSTLIVTTDDHVKRTRLEVRNHFSRKGRKNKAVQIEVVSPSSSILDELTFASYLADQTKLDIFNAIMEGRSNDLNGGLNETLATIIAGISVRWARKKVQGWAERRTHEYTPAELARIQSAARIMWKSAKK